MTASEELKDIVEKLKQHEKFYGHVSLSVPLVNRVLAEFAELKELLLVLDSGIEMVGTIINGGRYSEVWNHGWHLDVSKEWEQLGNGTKVYMMKAKNANTNSNN